MKAHCQGAFAVTLNDSEIAGERSRARSAYKVCASPSPCIDAYKDQRGTT